MLKFAIQVIIVTTLPRSRRFIHCIFPICFRRLVADKSPEFGDARSQIESLITEVVEQLGSIAQEISSQAAAYIATPISPEDRMSDEEVNFWTTIMRDIDAIVRSKAISDMDGVFLRRLARRRNAELKIIFSAYPYSALPDLLVRELHAIISEHRISEQKL